MRVAQLLALALALRAQAVALREQAAAVCASERDCTLSGECVGGRCVCDKP